MTPGQHFRQSSAPRSPTPASRRRLGRSRLRPFLLPYGAAMISPAVEPCFCGRLGNARGATDSCTKMLRAWGVSLPRFSRPGISCGCHCGQTGAQDLSRKCCAGLNPPLRGDPRSSTKARPAIPRKPTLFPSRLPFPPAPIFADENKKIPRGPSNTFFHCGVTGFSCCFGRKKALSQS